MQNYKVNTPAKFRKNQLQSEDGETFRRDLAKLVGVPADKIDYVYFSCAKGAEPHTDQLDPEKFVDTTYVIPVILPRHGAIIMAGEASVSANLGEVYEFDHTKIHSMFVHSDEGCAVIMATELRK